MVLLMHFQCIHVDAHMESVEAEVRRKDPVIETSSVGSCGVGNSGDRVALFSSRDPVTDSYSLITG
jgi:hypothetical protein